MSTRANLPEDSCHEMRPKGETEKEFEETGEELLKLELTRDQLLHDINVNEQLKKRLIQVIQTCEETEIMVQAFEELQELEKKTELRREILLHLRDASKSLLQLRDAVNAELRQAQPAAEGAERASTS